MPLRQIEWNADQHGWALWTIEETEQTLAEMALPDVCPDNIVSLSKRREWLGGRVLAKMLVEKAELPYLGLLKDEFGKPSLDQHSHHISLSHSFPFVAAQMSDQPVGIDIEQPRAKLIKIAPRVFNSGEQRDAGTDIIKNCIYWCAKEALYKIHGLGGISFSKNLWVESFQRESSGDLLGTISPGKMIRQFKLHYVVEKEFVLVYTKKQV